MADTRLARHANRGGIQRPPRRTGAHGGLGGLIGLLVAETLAVVALSRLGSVSRWQIDWSHLWTWLEAVPPEDGLLAIGRWVAFLVAAWLLGSSLLYSLARLSRVPGLVRGTRWLTLPVIRSMVDRALVVGLAASTLVSVRGTAALADPLHAPAALSRPPAAAAPAETAARSQVQAAKEARRSGHAAAVSLTPTIAGSNRPASGAPSSTVERGVDAVERRVQPGEDLWGIAASHLARTLGRAQEDLATSDVAPYWRMVVEMNRQTLRSGHPGLIHPGEVIRLPPPGAGAGIVPDPRSEPEYRVQVGDSLSSIASTQLGDARRWPMLFEVNHGVPQADGRSLDAPDLLRPGWTLTVPRVEQVPVPADGGAPPETGTANERFATAPTPSDDTSSPEEGAKDKVSASPTTSVAGRVGGRPRSPAADREPAVSSVGAQRGHDRRWLDPIRSAILAGVPVSVAGVVLLRLDRLRRGQQRNRRRGRDIARPTPSLEPVERRVRAIAPEVAAEWVDLTLRYAWSVLVGADPAAVPSVVCVRPGKLGVELLLDPPIRNPPGWFVAHDDGQVWRLGPEIRIEELRMLGGGESALVPALVTVGMTSEGPVLVDLERFGVLSVEGDPARVEAFLAGAALELSTAPWASNNSICLVGGDARLGALEMVDISEDGESLDGMVAGFGESLSSCPSTLAARVTRGNVEAWAPTVVVAAPGSAAIGWLSHAARRCLQPCAGLTMVAAGPIEGASLRLTIDADGGALLDPLSLAVEVNVDAETVAGLVALLASAGDLEDVAPVIDFPTTETEAPAGGADRVEGEVSVLGPVTVSWSSSNGGHRPRRVKLEEIVAYLGTHDGRPVPGERLRTAVWPLRDDPRLGEVADSTFRATMSRVRSALGRDSLGLPHLPEAREGRYHLGPRFDCDWSRFKRLVRQARASASGDAIGILRDALSLVRGTPFADVPRGAYSWVWSEQLVSEIEVAVADAAEELAERALEAGDPDTARWASRQGLLVVPSREALYRTRMSAAFEAGDYDDIHQAYVEAQRAARAVDELEELQDETTELYARLRRACRSTGTGRVARAGGAS